MQRWLFKRCRCQNADPAGEHLSSIRFTEGYPLLSMLHPPMDAHKGRGKVTQFQSERSARLKPRTAPHSRNNARLQPKLSNGHIEHFRRSMMLGSYGGEGGIRTHVRVSPKHAFQACAFNHSATSPLNGCLLEFTITAPGRTT